MRTVTIILLCYLGLIIFWWVWGNLAYAKAVKDKNKRIYQEAEKKRLEASYDAYISDVAKTVSDYEDGTEQHPYIHEKD